MTPSVLSSHWLLSAVALLSATAPALPAYSASQPHPRSTLEKIRQLLGLTPPIAIGGSRSGRGGGACLISPRPQVGPAQEAISVVPVPRPTILAAGELNEVRLEQDGKILWRRQASSTQPIEGPIPWPLEPIKPGESVVLKLRPRGAAGGEFAVVTLTAPSISQGREAESLIEGLGQEPAAWLKVIQQQAEQGNRALAMGLLFAPSAPDTQPLRDLRAALVRQGCR